MEALGEYVTAVGNTAAFPDRILLGQAFDHARAALKLAGEE